MLSFEASKDRRFPLEASANLRVAHQVLVNDLESHAIALGESPRVVDDSGRTLPEHAHDLEFTGEQAAGGEGRQRAPAGHTSIYRRSQAARIFGETRTGSSKGRGSFAFHAAHAAAAADRASSAT